MSLRASHGFSSSSLRGNPVIRGLILVGSISLAGCMVAQISKNHGPQPEATTPVVSTRDATAADRVEFTVKPSSQARASEGLKKGDDAQQYRPMISGTKSIDAILMNPRRKQDPPQAQEKGKAE